MLKNLTYLANHLDKKGLTKEANRLDLIIRKIAADNNYRIIKKAGGIKVVYNDAFSIFKLSKEGEALYEKLSGKSYPGTDEVERHDPVLVHVVETLGERANGEGSLLEIWVIEGNQYSIIEHDGAETVNTPENMGWETVESQDFSFLDNASQEFSD